MERVFTKVGFVGFSIMAIIFPFLVKQGYVDNWYTLMGSIVSIYGGLIAISIRMIQQRNR